ncbi:MAG TPA: hypothetical protein EYO59_12825 [Chromatiaceae bacterium]|nr:hypothetical protein [Chromatiaceae bacterium]
MNPGPGRTNKYYLLTAITLGLSILFFYFIERDTTPQKTPAQTTKTNQHQDVAYWTCPMHHFVRELSATTCPLCKMDLTPVTQQSLKAGTIMVNAKRRQLIGVRSEIISTRPLTRKIRAAGKLVFDKIKKEY